MHSLTSRAINSIKEDKSEEAYSHLKGAMIAEKYDGFKVSFDTGFEDGFVFIHLDEYHLVVNQYAGGACGCSVETSDDFRMLLKKVADLIQDQ